MTYLGGRKLNDAELDDFMGRLADAWGSGFSMGQKVDKLTQAGKFNSAYPPDARLARNPYDRNSIYYGGR